jgi:Leucine-rich repeat (LRR) protein
MWKSPENLIWIDLSYNYLVTIDEEILKFPNLQNLYLNYNYIKDLSQTQKLGKLKNLKSLNLFGNPVEQVPGYRMWVLGVMYEESDSLKKFD